VPEPLPKRSSEPALPLTNIQSDVLRLLASHRDSESYVAGATPLNRNTTRYSSDIDVFHDREERVVEAAFKDAATLEAAGYRVQWTRQFPSIHSANIIAENEQTRLEWVADSDFRFFPTIADETFGYVLHPVDLAMNKLMAAAGRRAVRDLVDLVTIHETILPIGAAAWAAVEKSPGFTPEGLIAEIRRNSHYSDADWKRLDSTVPLDPKAITQRLRTILEEAEAFIAQMPTAKAGLLFLEAAKVVQPDPAKLDTYQTHSGQRQGHWPSSPEIATAMLEHYTAKASHPDPSSKQ
jgi:hypothetical protein